MLNFVIRIRLKLLPCIIGTGLLTSATLSAATTATATVTYTIGTINAISVSGSPAALVVNTATAGSPPTSATDTSTTYALTTNATGKVITAGLSAAMPTGVSLTVTMAAPTGGTSAGGVALTAVAQNLVTAISNVAQSGLQITYVLAATVAAAAVGPSTTTVTYTIL